MTRSSSSLNSYIMTMTVTAAQILNLVGNPVTLIPAPGASSIILVSNVVVTMDFNSVAYSSLGASSALVAYPGNVSQGVNIQDMLTVASDGVVVNDSDTPGNPSDNYDMLDSPIVLATDQTDNYILGNSDLVITIYYNIIKTSL